MESLHEDIVVNNAKDPKFVIRTKNKYFNIDFIFRYYKNMSGLK